MITRISRDEQYVLVEAIKAKALKDLTDDDLLKIGFTKVGHEEFDDFFFYQDLNGVKVYMNRVADKFELRGFMLRKEYQFYTRTAG